MRRIVRGVIAVALVAGACGGDGAEIDSAAAAVRVVEVFEAVGIGTPGDPEGIVAVVEENGCDPAAEDWEFVFAIAAEEGNVEAVAASIAAVCGDDVDPNRLAEALSPYLDSSIPFVLEVVDAAEND